MLIHEIKSPHPKKYIVHSYVILRFFYLISHMYYRASQKKVSFEDSNKEKETNADYGKFFFKDNVTSNQIEIFFGTLSMYMDTFISFSSYNKATRPGQLYCDRAEWVVGVSAAQRKGLDVKVFLRVH